MDHRAFLRTLTSQQRKQLTAKSDAKGLLHLVVHAGLIIVVGGLIIARIYGWPLLLPVQGVLLVFLFTLLHETVHETVFEKVWLNRIVGRVCGFMIFLPASWFKYFHLAHHRHTHDQQNDPELAAPKPQTLREYLVYLSGIPVWISHFKTLFINAAGKCKDDFVPSQKRSRLRDEARIMLFGYLFIAVICLWFRSYELVFVWLLPLLLGQPFLRAYLLAEHGKCPHVANMFENTRTTFTTLAVRKLAWNMPYHAEHHTYPTVPFYQLPRLHILMRQHLRVTENGYLRFHRKYFDVQLDDPGE